MSNTIVPVYPDPYLDFTETNNRELPTTTTTIQTRNQHNQENQNSQQQQFQQLQDDKLIVYDDTTDQDQMISSQGAILTQNENSKVASVQVKQYLQKMKNDNYSLTNIENSKKSIEEYIKTVQNISANTQSKQAQNLGLSIKKSSPTQSQFQVGLIQTHSPDQSQTIQSLSSNHQQNVLLQKQSENLTQNANNLQNSSQDKIINSYDENKCVNQQLSGNKQRQSEILNTTLTVVDENQKKILLENLNSQQAATQDLEQIPEHYEQFQIALQQSQKKVLELEESLKIEMLNSEEQRVYISILKRALEKKIDESPIRNELQQLSQMSNQKKVDLLVQMEKMSLVNLKIEDYHEKENLQSTNQKLKSQNRELLAFNEKMNDELQHAIEALTIAQTENKQLEQSKLELVQFVEKIQEEMQILKKISLEHEEHNSLLELRLKEFQEENETLKLKVDDSDNLTQQLSTQIQEKSNTASQLQSTNKELSEKIVEINKQNDQVSTDIRTQKEDLQKLIEEKQQYSKEKEQLNDQLQQKEQFIQDHQQQISQLNSLLEDFKSRLEIERQNKTEEIKTIFEQLSEIRSENRILKEEKSNLENHDQSLIDQLNQYKDHYEKQLKQFQSDNLEVQQLKIALKNQEIQIQKSSNDTKKYEDTIVELRNTLQTRDSLVKQLQDQTVKLEQQLTSQKQNELASKSKIEKLSTDADSFVKNLIQIVSRIREYQPQKQSSIKQNQKRLYDYSITELLQELSQRVDELFANKQVQSNSEQTNLVNQKLFSEVSQNLEKQEKLSQRLSNENQGLQTQLEQQKKDSLLQITQLKQRIEDADSQIKQYQAKFESQTKLEQQNSIKLAELECRKQELEMLLQKNQYDQKKNNNIEQYIKQANQLGEKVLILSKQKQEQEFFSKKSRNFIYNDEVVSLLDEACQVINQIINLESQRDELQAQCNQIEIKTQEEPIQKLISQNNKDNNLRFGESEFNLTRLVEQHKQKIADLESKIKIQNSRKTSLLSEITKLELSEKQKFIAYQKLDKLNHHLKSEVEMIRNELEMKEISKKNTEMAYQDLLQDYKRITNEGNKQSHTDQKKNSSNSKLSQTVQNRKSNIIQEKGLQSDITSFEKDLNQFYSSKQHKTDDQSNNPNVYRKSQELGKTQHQK